MRILHTADWHFGKTLEGRDRAPEQWAFIDELAAICDDEAVDFVLMAGDVYQTVNPSAEAEEMFYQALHKLAAGGRRGVVVIAGNHDHADRIRAPRWLADDLGIALVGLPKDEIRPTAERADRVWRPWGGVGAFELAIPSCPHRARIAAVPYPSESRLGEVLSETLDEREMRRSYSDRLAGWFADLARHFRPDTVNLLVSHVYVTGGIETDSEIQIQVGGAYAVDPSAFPASAQYVALGHLHRPQVMEGAVRRAHPLRRIAPCVQLFGGGAAEVGHVGGARARRTGSVAGGAAFERAPARALEGVEPRRGARVARRRPGR